MATGIVEGLFGVTPEMYQQQQANRAFSEAAQFAQLSPFQQAGAGIMYGAGQATRGLLGVEDPMLNLYRNRQQIARQFDVNTPEGLTQYAQALRSANDIQGALQVSTLANQAAKQIAQTRLAQQQLTSAEITGQREQQLQSALSQLPEDASEQQIQGVLRRYGDPKTVLQALERKNNLDAQLAERRRIQEEQNQFRREQLEKDQNFQMQLARLQADLKAGTTSLQQQLIQEKIDTLRQKKQDAIDAQLASAEGVVRGTQTVLGKVEEADKLVGKATTGIGSYLSIVPGTSARELSSAIATIKSRLGFDQLQQMRNASPTGGALGQVAVKELEALQAAVSSLDQGLSPEALKRNLGQIKQSYENWQNAALNKLSPEKQKEILDQRGGAGGAGAATGGVVDFNSLNQ
jgi:phage tail tube protein FII